MLSCRLTRLRACAATRRRRDSAIRFPARLGRIAALVLAVFATASCGILSKQYEYDEEIYLALDGSATVYVNGSVPALVALRGLPLDVKPRALLDRNQIRALYTSPVTQVTRVSTSRRNGRRFVHVRMTVSDIRGLNTAAPFGWSSYAFVQRGNEYVYTQHVGASTQTAVGDVGWKGDELVAFRMHLPAKIRYHNAPSKLVERGNILSWEQPLKDRLAGTPLVMEVRLDTQSILYRTLWLFGAMIGLVAVLFIAIIWWVVRTGRRAAG
jgi:hypothetical protein